MIKLCACQHPGQDKLHGKWMRVFNQTRQAEPEKDRKWRCTVCGRLAD